MGVSSFVVGHMSRLLLVSLASHDRYPMIDFHGYAQGLRVIQVHGVRVVELGENLVLLLLATSALSAERGGRIGRRAHARPEKTHVIIMSIVDVGGVVVLDGWDGERRAGNGDGV